MKIGLLGTGFGVAHAAIYHRHPDVDDVVVFGRTPSKLDTIAETFGCATTTNVDDIYTDAGIDLIDVCLPTPLHTEHVLRALAAGKDVLCELPLALTIAEAMHIGDAHAASQRQVFVDMFGRFDQPTALLREAAADGRYGPLENLEVELRTALLWPGYTLELDSIILDMMHASLDTIITTLGPPARATAAGVVGTPNGSAAEVLLTYNNALARCTASSLMPKSYNVAGGYRATFADAVLGNTYTAGFTGQPNTTLVIEHTGDRRSELELPTVDSHAAVISHVLDCLHERATNQIDPASVLATLQLTLDVHHQLNSPHVSA